ncbi:hypothetical protein [Diaphorobacter sp.]|nr:hypothetical protein [Diaphorobacter sp.]
MASDTSVDLTSATTSVPQAGSRASKELAVMAGIVMAVSFSGWENAAQ